MVTRRVIEHNGVSRRTFLAGMAGLGAMALVPGGLNGAPAAPGRLVMPNLRGVMVFLITPMIERSGRAEVDYEGMRRNIEFYARQTGPFCLCLCGGTGEFSDLTAEEILRLTEAAATAKRDRILIVGVGGADTRETIQRAQGVQRAGADALLAMPVKAVSGAGQEAMYEHYATLCRNVDIGALPYRRPEAPMEMDTVLRLAEIPNFVALKSAGKEADWYREVFLRTNGDLPIFPASESMAPYWHLAGCAGFTSGLVDLVPRKSVGLWETLDLGDYRKGVKLADAFRPLYAFRAKHGTPMLKAGLELLGYAGGPVRKSMKVLGDAERQELRQLMTDMEAFAAD